MVLSAKQTMHVCERLFTHRRWNCHSIRKAPNYLPDLTGGGWVSEGGGWVGEGGGWVGEGGGWVSEEGGLVGGGGGWVGE